MLTSNARMGLVLFFVYLLFYAAFVFINAFSAETMEWMPIDGVNFAIVSGFGLIVGAFILALIYGVLCKSEQQMDDERSAKKKGDA